MKSTKKIFFLFLILASLTNAQFSINLGAGKDFYSVPATSENTFSLWDGTFATLDRSEISNPLYLNLQLEYRKNSFIYGLHIAGAYQEYHYHYKSVPVGIPDVTETEGDAPWVRIEINGVFLYNYEMSNNFDFIFGFGGGYQIVPPIVSQKFIYETTYNKLSTFDFSDEVELEYLPNAKIVARVKYKISNSFSLSLETNYLIIKQGKYDQPSKFSSLALFLGYTF